MPPAPSLLERAAATGEQRAGRDLYSFRMHGSLAERVALAKPGPGGVGKLVADVPVLKVGAFHGGEVILDVSDLAAMVERFAQLRTEADFTPPVRADHGWSVWDVVGHTMGLRVTDLADPTDGRSKPFLVADLHIISEQALERIGNGLWLHRSSELGAYGTNAGAFYSLAFWGVAFVDIPAVEGLGAVKLSALSVTDRAPHRITELTEGGAVSATAGTEAPTTGTPPVAEGVAPDGTPIHTEEEVVATSGLPDDAPLDEPEGGAPATGTATAGSGDGASADAPPAGTDPAPSTVGGTPPPAGTAPTEAELAAARALLGITSPSGALAAAGAARAPLGEQGLSAEQVLRDNGFTEQADELAAQRVRAVDAQVTALAQDGRIPPRNTEALAAARTLLGHTGAGVAEAARTLLGSLVPPITPGERLGTQTSETGPGGDDTLTPQALGKLPVEEFPQAWAQLSTEQRASTEGQAAYAQYLRARG